MALLTRAIDTTRSRFSVLVQQAKQCACTSKASKATRFSVLVEQVNQAPVCTRHASKTEENLFRARHARDRRHALQLMSTLPLPHRRRRVSNATVQYKPVVLFFFSIAACVSICPSVLVKQSTLIPSRYLRPLFAAAVRLSLHPRASSTAATQNAHALH